MKTIRINFQESDIKILTALICNIAHITNLDTVINKGLNQEEWTFLCKILELDVIHVPNHQGDLIPTTTGALKDKIRLSIEND